MKRSEMINKLTSLLHDQYRNPYTQVVYDQKKFFEDAEEILDMLEFQGMLPPPSSIDKWIDCGKGQGFTSYSHQMWEPEDD